MMNNSFMFRWILSFYQKRCTIIFISSSSTSSNSSSPSNNMYSTVKKLMDDKKYKQVLSLFDKQLDCCTDDIIHMVVKACSYLHEHQRITDIEQNLSSKSLNNSYIQTALLQFYIQNHDMKNACRLFSTINNKSNYTYAIMFKGLVSNKMSEKVLNLFVQTNIQPNHVILTILFTACAHVANDRAKNIGRKLLQKMPKHFYNDNVIITSALDMLMKFGDVENAENFFQMMKKKDVIAYNAMMKGYVENKMYEKTLDLFEQLPFSLHNVGYIIIFNACAQLLNDRAKQIGKKLLQQIPKYFHNDNVIITSALDMLMKFGDVENAENLFQMMKKKDIIAYGAMMNGCNINNQPFKCLQLLEKIKQQNFIIDEFSSSILINACARLSMLSKCQLVVDQIPSYLYKNQHILNSLIYMWGKAGSIEDAQKIFQSIDNPDDITYNSLIYVYGLNHMGLEAVDLYRKMPNHLRNEVTYVCVLNACSHSGLLDQAHSIFNEISQKSKKIIAAMVDCLSRLYIFDEAQKLIDDYEKSNPPSSVMYMAILSGARNSRQHILSQKIYDRMTMLFPNEKEALKSGSVLLGNTYLSIGDHEQAENVRLNRIKELGTKIQLGVSWTEFKGEILEFKANDRRHPRSEEIHAKAKYISDVLIKHGHEYDASWITRSLGEDETTESVLCTHSERLAIAYHFLQEENPSFIQITKNLRVCGDCHRATKLIAKIWQCKIIVRDANCIHHFSPDGTCSCQDQF
ncbi:unnamed protein product [Rotaria sp. Silwood1]|nr:unnamed protein product [Rotaria sp. Silwood1]